MESILISGMAVALLIAVVEVFGLPVLVTGALSAIANAAFMWSLTARVAPVQILAAIFVTAFLGLVIRAIDGSDTPRVVRRLRKQVPDL